MIDSLGMKMTAEQDILEIMGSDDAEEHALFHRAFRELTLEMTVDGPFKGSIAPFDRDMRGLEDEQKLLRVIYDVSRAQMDRYIEVLHFVRVSSPGE